MERALNTLPDEKATECPILNNGAFLRLYSSASAEGAHFSFYSCCYVEKYTSNLAQMQS
jgi:hypothetical protein